MKLAIITAACYPDRSRIHFLDESARRNGINLRPFGIGIQYSNWRQMLLEQTLPAIASYENEFTHVMYVDGADSLFLASEQEIVAKFERYWGDAPCVMSGDPDPKNFLNAGGFITKIPFFVGLMKTLSEKYADDGDYQNWLLREWPVPGIELDQEAIIFQSMNGSSSVVAVAHRAVNCITGQWPCVLHFRGGYSDPRTGRDERMAPWVKKLWGDS